MTDSHWTVRAQRALALAAVPASALVNVGGVAVAQVAALSLVAVLLLAFQACRSTLRRALTVPVTPATVALGCFVLALGVATATSDVPLLSVYGAYGRHSGLLLYLGAAAVALVIVRRFTHERLPTLATAVVAVGGAIALWGLGQRVGLLASGGQALYGPRAVLASLGNPNFVAGYLGIAVPLAVWLAWSAGRSAALRIAAGVAAALMLVTLPLTDSVQGPVAAAAGTAVVVLTGLWARGGRIRSRVLPVAAAATGLGVIAVIAGLFQIGPLAALAVQGTVQLRAFYWVAAVRMLGAQPLVGVGLDRYGGYYRAYQPLESALLQDVGQNVDAPHNVILAMLSGGGLVLGLAYLAVLACTAAALVSAARRHAGDPERLLLVGAVAGGWVAYQAQALVSIDMPPLALLHWVLAGMAVVLAYPDGVPTVTWGAKPPVGKRRARRPGAARVALAVLVCAVVVVTGTVVVIRPLRADLATGLAVALREQGDLAAAQVAHERATAAAPWESRHWFEHARSLIVAGGALTQAQAILHTAASRDPRSLPAAVTSARLAEGLGGPACAAAWYAHALELEPQSPELHAEVEEFQDAPADDVEPECAAVDRALAGVSG